MGNSFNKNEVKTTQVKSKNFASNPCVNRKVNPSKSKKASDKYSSNNVSINNYAENKIVHQETTHQSCILSSDAQFPMQTEIVQNIINPTKLDENEMECTHVSNYGDNVLLNDTSLTQSNRHSRLNQSKKSISVNINNQPEVCESNFEKLSTCSLQLMQRIPNKKKHRRVLRKIDQSNKTSSANWREKSLNFAKTSSIDLEEAGNIKPSEPSEIKHTSVSVKRIVPTSMHKYAKTPKLEIKAEKYNHQKLKKPRGHDMKKLLKPMRCVSSSSTNTSNIPFLKKYRKTRNVQQANQSTRNKVIHKKRSVQANVNDQSFSNSRTKTNKNISKTASCLNNLSIELKPKNAVIQSTALDLTSSKSIKQTIKEDQQLLLYKVHNCNKTCPIIKSFGVGGNSNYTAFEILIKPGPKQEKEIQHADVQTNAQSFIENVISKSLVKEQVCQTDNVATESKLQIPKKHFQQQVPCISDENAKITELRKSSGRLQNCLVENSDIVPEVTILEQKFVEKSKKNVKIFTLLPKNAQMTIGKQATAQNHMTTPKRSKTPRETYQLVYRKATAGNTFDIKQNTLALNNSLKTELNNSGMPRSKIRSRIPLAATSKAIKPEIGVIKKTNYRQAHCLKDINETWKQRVLSDRDPNMTYCIDVYIEIKPNHLQRILDARSKLINFGTCCKIRVMMNDVYIDNVGERRRRIRIEGRYREDIVKCMDMLDELLPDLMVWNNGVVQR